MATNVYAKKYKTMQGDTWDAISIDFYRSPYFMKELIDANPVYSDVLVFDAGVELSIPIIANTETSTSLPPWKA